MADLPLLLALDQGTSSSRAAIFDSEGNLIISKSCPLNIEYPHDGWVEQSPETIWESQLNAMISLKKALTKGQLNSIVSCGITNQRETTILWRRSDGKPCGPALVWQDGRTKEICEQWKKDGLESIWKQRTGLLLDPYFSASKIKWLLDNLESARQARDNNDICFGTVESWLVWNLTKGRKHISDMSNGSRTLLMDLEKRLWVDEFCENIGLPINALPELVPCRGDYGVIDSDLPFDGVPIQALLGDQQAATLGQLCLNEGEAKCTYGTGAFLVVNTGNVIRRSSCGLLSTLAWTDNQGTPTYCIEGSLFNAGTVVQWLRDQLMIIKDAKEINNLAEKSTTTESNLMFVPGFTGWGTPHWDPDARGLIIGLTRNTSKEDLARAALEGIALSVATLVKLAEESINHPLQELAVDGGAAASNPLLQAQADSTGLRVRRPLNIESTAKGAALFAGLQAGVISDLKDLTKSKSNEADTFHPKLDVSHRKKWLSKWEEAVKRSLEWYE
tara:strand:- start:372 stop:1880 length:1509 start_codon:yes stop_codon:yes gene_type:complete